MNGETTIVIVPGYDTTDVKVGEERTEIIGDAGVGPMGPKGDPGDAGVGLAFVHTQDSPSALWTVAHNLDAFPNVTVVDTLMRQVEADVEWIDANTIEVGFATAATGQVFIT